ncbi:transporter substrate-binding domain-containing protein [Phytomonospora sp. NPDC050363]|uniref:substrate-binding periplasmic protein n=1 Tax=Phytomonospora sp. NPDC050363 TaxID=3155642 RepID=UPI0033EC2CD9
MAAQLKRTARLAGTLATVLAIAASAACTGGASDTEYGLSREGKLSVCVVMPTPMYAQTGADQQLTGLDVDVLAKVTEMIDLEPNYITIAEEWIGTDKPFDEAKCEVIAGGRIVDAATRDVLDYTRPYLRTHASMLVRVDSKVKEPADLSGEVLATPGDRPWTGVVSAYAADWGVTQAPQADMVAALAALDAGDVPAVLADDASLRYLAQAQPGRYRLVEGVDEPFFPVAFATSIYIETDLRDDLNEAIGELDENGALATMRQTWTGV